MGTYLKSICGLKLSETLKISVKQERIHVVKHVPHSDQILGIQKYLEHLIYGHLIYGIFKSRKCRISNTAVVRIFLIVVSQSTIRISHI